MVIFSQSNESIIEDFLTFWARGGSWREYFATVSDGRGAQAKTKANKYKSIQHCFQCDKKHHSNKKGLKSATLNTTTKRKRRDIVSHFFRFVTPAPVCLAKTTAKKKKKHYFYHDIPKTRTTYKKEQTGTAILRCPVVDFCRYGLSHSSGRTECDDARTHDDIFGSHL
jgi:hypothetical protein